MFAYDTSLYISDSNKENVFKIMEEQLRKFATWLKANKLSRSISKTKYSLFSSKRKRKEIPNILPPLSIDTLPNKREFASEFLGVYLDENISWENHINIVSTKVSKSIRTFYTTRYILKKYLSKQLYFPFISCYLNYANTAWASTNKTKLQALYRHKHAARMIIYFCKTTSLTN